MSDPMLDRAWPRRPLVSPPPFGRSVPDIWADTEVVFLRRISSDNGIGGTSGADQAELLTVMANVSLSPEPGIQVEVGAGGAVRRRFYLTIFEVDPATFDWDLLPRKGDYETFVDPGGRAVTVPIDSVLIPEGIVDHIEIESTELD